MTKDNDAVLVAECLNGQTEAFGVLVARYEKPIYNIAYRMVHSYEDARDLTQAVFLKAYEKLEQFNPKYKFFSWIYRMAINETINFLQSQKRSTPAGDYHLAHNQTPEGHYHTRQIAEDIDDALSHLTFDYRIVVVLRHFQDLPYNEISQILHIPEKTVKSRLFSARRLLGQLLAEEARGN